MTRCAQSPNRTQARCSQFPAFGTRRARTKREATMTTAKIYQFPARVRPAPGGRREEAKAPEILAAPSLPSLRVAKAAFGSACYHEEAVQEAERSLTSVSFTSLRVAG